MAVSEPRIRWRVGLAAALTAVVVIVGMSGLLKPLANACVMTYMYPTYIPVPAAPNTQSGKYGLFLYHEGWKKIDFAQHLRALSGVPVLFIPGNGGSYKQVRSLAAESDRAFNGGPHEESFYQEALLTPEEAAHDLGSSVEDSWESHIQVRELLAETEIQGEYINHLDWFAVDLEGEHSAMDGRILEEHTEYVVQAIHRILDQYKDSFEARSGKKISNADMLPASVILVGHSMGGFVARAVVVHPDLRKGAVETILTLSSPHLLAPIALQPSLGHFFSRINDKWRNGYEVQRPAVESPLSRVVVVSIPGGVHDFQVRSRMASVDGIIPATHGLTVGAPGMLNAWLSTEHQTILWCNQLIVQVAHTLLQIIDKNTAQVYSSPRTRLAIFVAKFRSGLPQAFEWLPKADSTGSLSGNEKTKHVSEDNSQTFEHTHSSYSCPKSISWESQERDLQIESSSVTVLAMDGRRRWLDIRKQTSKGRTHFVLMTNLFPCLGIRVHLWHEKGKVPNERVVEVTRKMVQIPAGPAPRQIEPGGQTEQPPPSGVLRLDSKDLENFRYISISVAPRPTVSGRPPPAASMAVGQFFNSADGNILLSSSWLLSSVYKRRNILLGENHPLVMNLTVSIALGLLPLSLTVETASCGIPDSAFAKQQAGDSDAASLCKLRCFPPVALVWDRYSGLQIFPNLVSQTIIADSSPMIEGGSHQSSLILLVDPHCGYSISMEVVKSAALGRFLLTHGPQVAGFMVAVLLFALMRQTRAWELDIRLPSIFACMERNLLFPLPFLPLFLGPLLVYSILSMLGSGVFPPFLLSATLAFLCYIVATGVMGLLSVGTMLLFHATASFQVFLKLRWQLHWLLTPFSFIFTLPFVRKVREHPTETVCVVATILIFFIHPVIGLILLLLSHAWSCHVSLCGYRQQRTAAMCNGTHKLNGHANNNDEKISYAESQLELFKFYQGLLLLHFTATAMLLPSFIAWAQRPKVAQQTLSGALDSVLSFGLILHSFYASNVDADISVFRYLPYTQLRDSGMSFVYGVGGVWCYWAGLGLVPYRAFYCLALIGLLMAALRFRHHRCCSATVDADADACGIHLTRRHFHRH